MYLKLKHFVILFSQKILNGAKECCCCMLNLHYDRFRWSPKILAQGPFHMYLYLPILYKAQVWVLSDFHPEAWCSSSGSCFDCKRSDLVNSNQNIAITLWEGPLRNALGLAEVKKVQFTLRLLMCPSHMCSSVGLLWIHALSSTSEL